MIRYMIPLMAVGATAAAIAAPATAAEVQIAVQGPVVELTVNEIVRSAPDLAQIGAGVHTRAPTAREAVRQNAEAMEKVIARIAALGIPREDIQTSNYNLSPNYRYNQETGEQTFTGYDVNNQVNVRLRDMERIGEVLDALVTAGANTIHGPNFMLEDDMAAKEEARSLAFTNGRRMAEEYARRAGYSGVRLLEVSETVQSHGPYPQAEIMVTGARMDAAAKTPIEPGEVTTSVTMTVKYEMTQ